MELAASTRFTWGVIFLASLEPGHLTPPVGLNLYLAPSRFGKPFPTVFATRRDFSSS